MILSVQDAIRDRVLAAVKALYHLEGPEVPAVTVAGTPNRTLGDLAVPLAFELARRLRKAPRAIGQEIATSLGTIPGVQGVECTANGYLNFRLDRPAFLESRLAGQVPLPELPSTKGKAIVEHTAINPNKAAHIGHLRNAALGDTLVRALQFLGQEVEIQNYIDDTGVQVADVVVGFSDIERQSLADVERIAATTRFDYHCWDLYARVTEWYQADKTRLAIRAEALHDIEHGSGERAAIARFVADRIVRCHLSTMARMNVHYDLLSWEGDILRLQFWNRAFEILKSDGTVYLQTKGRLAGCWVMRITDEGDPAARTDGQDAATGAETGALDEEEEGDQAEKVIVRSNGTVTYVGKDMAYQFWKFGLLGRDFHYRLFGAPGKDGPLWATSSTPTPEEASHPPFGRGATIYNVIDVRQAYLQKLLQQALAAAGHHTEADHSIHFSYEMVALSHQTARQLGYSSEAAEAGRPFVEVSGRKGLGVKADDLIDALVTKAEGEVARRNPEMAPPEVRRTAEMIGIAAIRYFLVKFSRGKVIAFDIDEALNFEGESGPYLQYAVVRANNIFQKLRTRDGLDEVAVVAKLKGTSSEELTSSVDDSGLWALILEAARLDEVSLQAVRTLEFSGIAKWALGLAQLFNAYYHRYPVLNEEQLGVKLWRAAGVAYFRAQLTRALDLMGIEIPVRM